jgi:phosphate transport system substrate-binding protein
MRLLAAIVTTSFTTVLCSADPNAVRIDGSSTVYPITLAVAEQFGASNPSSRIEVGVSGSSAGIRKLIAREIDIADSSRPLKESEVKELAALGIEVIELPVAFDGITVCVNRKNTAIDHLTTKELKAVWEPESRIQSWSQVRKGWPDTPLTLFGPGKDSGTMDYFTEAINGKSRAIRADHTGSEDDNELVQGVVGSPGGMGYFGFAYFLENASMLRALPINAGQGPVEPSLESIRNGTYRPLSRPLFIYVNAASLTSPVRVSFVQEYLRQAPKVCAAVGYVPLLDSDYELVRRRFAERMTGSPFATAKPGQSIDQVLAAGRPAARPAAAPVAAPAAVAVAAPAAVAVAAVAPKPAPPAWKPSAKPEEIAAQVEALRSASLALARASLDPATPVEELDRREREVRVRSDWLKAQGAGAPRPLTVAELQAGGIRP